MRYSASILLFLTAFLLQAQEYQVFNIPDSLKKDADAVVRNFSVKFIQKNENEGVYRVTKVTTVLNKNGEDYGNFVIYGDKFKTLTDFSGTMRNASGEITRKIKKSDLNTSSLSMDAGTLGSDDIQIWYDCKSPSYPYTVEYSYVQRWKNGILSYPVFSLGGYNVSLEKADYYLEVPDSQEVRYKSNYESEVSEQLNPTSRTYFTSLSNKKAVKYEKYSPSHQDILPLVFFAPGDFCYDSYCGNMSDWKNYGLWVNTLLEGRNFIPVELENKIKELTKDAPSEREKVKIVYEYLQNNTRYVNIAFGIGGYQPFDAQTVYKTNFGDCKALTNYTKAMLDALGIRSDYTLISTKVKDLYKDYPNFYQLDHVILLVPLQNDSIWLECTSATLPFGYIHKSIAGHDALVITEEGGKICRLPSYSGKDNKVVTKVAYSFNEDDQIEGELSISGYLAEAESLHHYIRSNERKNLVNYINSMVGLGKADFRELKASVNKENTLSAHLSTSFNASNFINKTGTRSFLPVCPPNKNHLDIFKSKTRNLPVEISAGFVEVDTVIVNIPESYVPESLPKPVKLNTAYGNFSAKVEKDAGRIVYIQEIEIFSGKYDSSEYDDIKSFFNRIVSASRRKLVLKKEI